MLRSPRYSGPVPRPAWARLSPFPSRLLVAPAHGAEPLVLGLLFLTVASSALVQIDIIYSVMMVLTAGAMLLLGLRFDRRNAPFIALLVIYNLGGHLSLQQVTGDENSRAFLVGTAFVATSGTVAMLALNENALARLEAIRWGMIAGALVSSFVGYLGYVRLVSFATLHGDRVMGTFRDPNVFGSFAAAAAVMLAADILANRRWLLAKLGMLLFICGAVFLSFSRGSWVNLALGLALLSGLTLLTTRDAALRARVLVAILTGALVLTLALGAMLLNENTADLFADRFVLQKDYDSGPSGRFGNQIRAIPDLLGRPFGHGPLYFAFFYPEDPHNTYISAFSYYGWLGGIAFLCFIVALSWLILRAVFTRSPFQSQAIMLCAVLVPHLVQNFQIDTDRWRHLFLIYGMSWGLAVITARYRDEYLSYAHGAYRAAAARAQGFQVASSPA